MSRRTPLEFDISVSADKKKRARARGMSGAVETSSRKCDHEGCGNPGKYRAPKSVETPDEFLWFCLEHVRVFNQKWNFFNEAAAPSPDEQRQADGVWGRNTKPFSGPSEKQRNANPEGRAWQRFGFDDPHEVLGDNATMNPANPTARTSQRRLPPTERKALDILGARDDMTKAEIRKVYKALVKDLHPDTNSGSRADEDRLTEVVWAWDQVKASRSFRD